MVWSVPEESRELVGGLCSSLETIHIESCVLVCLCRSRVTVAIETAARSLSLEETNNRFGRGMQDFRCLRLAIVNAKPLRSSEYMQYLGTLGPVS